MRYAIVPEIECKNVSNQITACQTGSLRERNEELQITQMGYH